MVAWKKSARSLAAAASLSLLGFAVCCAVIRSMTGLPVALDSLDESEEKALHIDNVLAARDVDSFQDHALPGPGEREGFTNQDVFMRAHEGTQIQIAKNLDETEKTDPFFADRDELEDRNEQNGYRMKALLAKEDADEKRDMDTVLKSWDDHRQSLQDEVDYQEKMNGVLNDKADRVGEMLVRHTKQSTEAAEESADELERANEIQLKRYTKKMQDRQEALASQIVGLPDPSEPSEDEKTLLKQNILVPSLGSSASSRSLCGRVGGACLVHELTRGAGMT